MDPCLWTSRVLWRVGGTVYFGGCRPCSPTWEGTWQLFALCVDMFTTLYLSHALLKDLGHRGHGPTDTPKFTSSCHTVSKASHIHETRHANSRFPNGWGRIFSRSILICFPKAGFSLCLQKTHGNDDLNASLTSQQFEEQSVSDIPYKPTLLSALKILLTNCLYFIAPLSLKSMAGCPPIEMHLVTFSWKKLIQVYWLVSLK